MSPRRTDNPVSMVKGLYVYWGILGLCPFVPVEGSEILRFSCIRVVYTTTITLAYSFAYYRAIASRMNFILLRETSMYVLSDISGATVEFLVVVTAWLGFALRQNELKKILKGLKDIRVVFKDIGIDQDLEKIVTTMKVHTFSINFVWFVLFCCDHALLANSKVFELAIWIPFNFPRVITQNVMIMFVDAMLFVSKFFRLLNKKIRDLSSEVTSRPRLIVDRNRRRSGNRCFESVVGLGPLEVYGQIHSDLVTLTKMIVDFFSLTMILIVIVHFIQMASDLYIMCTLARDSTFTNWREGGMVAIWLSYGVAHFVGIVVLMAISESTVNEANRAGSMLHIMLASVRTEKYLASAQILSFRLLRRRLKIELYGLFEMSLSMVHGIIGMVGTYITVAIQLDAQDILQKRIDNSLSQPFGSDSGLWNETLTPEPE